MPNSNLRHNYPHLRASPQVRVKWGDHPVWSLVRCVFHLGFCGGEMCRRTCSDHWSLSDKCCPSADLGEGSGPRLQGNGAAGTGFHQTWTKVLPTKLLWWRFSDIFQSKWKERRLELEYENACFYLLQSFLSHYMKDPELNFLIWLHQASVASHGITLTWLPRGTWDLSSPTRDRTCVPDLARQTLSHWTASKAPEINF